MSAIDGRGVLRLEPVRATRAQVLLVSSHASFRLRGEPGWNVLSPSEAIRQFDAAAPGLRSDRLRDFLSEAGVTDVGTIGERDLHRRVRQAIGEHTAFVMRQDSASRTGSDVTANLRKLVRQVDETARGPLAFERRRYKLVVDVDLGRLPARNSYEVVGRVEAVRVLQGMAQQSSELTEPLGEVSKNLSADWRPPFQPDGIVLLRRAPAPVSTTPSTEPAMTPSQIKAEIEEEEAAEDTAEPTIRLVNVEAATFVPKAETLRISYAIDGPIAKAASVVMIVESVPAKGGRTVVQSLAVGGPYAASGEVVWDGKATTPGGFITLKGSPYEVKFELTSTTGKTSTSGPGKLRLELKDIKIVVDGAGSLAVPAASRPAVDGLVQELKKSGMPGDCAGRVIIDSPLFEISSSEMEDDSSFTKYATAAGTGLDVPLLARITLKSKAGDGKRSAPALIGIRVLWDFKLESSADLDGSLDARGMHTAAKTFVKKPASFEEALTQPKGTSAHMKVGGFRAKSADRATAGTQWVAGDKWTMTAPKARDWAALTDCGTGSDDVDSAVYFRPGHLAGNVHKVRAFVDVDEKLDVKDEAAPDGVPAPQRSNAIKLEVWRHVPIVATWTVGPKTTPISAAPLTKEYKKAGMIIEPGPGVVPTDITGTWKTEYKAVVDGYVKAKEPFLGKTLEVDPQGYPVRFIEYMDYWQMNHKDAGFWGRLWERIKNFFGAGDEGAYKKKCEDTYFGVLARTALRIPIPAKGITAVKFGENGPHNQNPESGSYTGGVAPAIPGLTDDTKAIFFQFTKSDDSDTFIHEVGHTLFLAHAPGHFEKGKQPAGYQPNAHDKDQVCIMSYASDKKALCGLCFLKLAGWKYSQINNDGSVKP